MPNGGRSPVPPRLRPGLVAMAAACCAGCAQAPSGGGGVPAPPAPAAAYDGTYSGTERTAAASAPGCRPPRGTTAAATVVIAGDRGAVPRSGGAIQVFVDPSGRVSGWSGAGGGAPAVLTGQVEGDRLAARVRARAGPRGGTCETLLDLRRR